MHYVDINYFLGQNFNANDADVMHLNLVSYPPTAVWEWGNEKHDPTFLLIALIFYPSLIVVSEESKTTFLLKIEEFTSSKETAFLKLRHSIWTEITEHFEDIRLKLKSRSDIDFQYYISNLALTSTEETRLVCGELFRRLGYHFPL